MAGEESDLETVLSAVQESCRWKLDRQIDFENDDGRGQVVHKNLGKIAKIMTDWEDDVADELRLTDSVKHDILAKNERKPHLQRREALTKWKGRLGRKATYKALIKVFVRASHSDYAHFICTLLNEGSSKPCGPSTGASSSSACSGGVQNGSSTVTNRSTSRSTPERQASSQSGGAQSNRSGSWSGPSSLTFSRKMGPGKLCEWLLQECGDDYAEDIGKVKTGGINGELFLDVPEDETLLQALELSPGFKRLLVKRAKQVEVQLNIPIDLTQSMSPSGSDASLMLQSYGQSLGPESLIEAGYGGRVSPFNPTTATLSEESYGLPVGQCHSTLTTMAEATLPEESLELSGIPVCITVDSDDEQEQEEEEADSGGQLDEDSQAAWVHKNVIWRKRKELRVKFLNNIPNQKPNRWMYAGSELNKGNIMSWANEWSLRAKGVIPEFVRVQDPSAESDIRVMFTTRGKTESKIGTKATNVPNDEPTMWLNLGGIDDGFKKYLVVHEFGHALGLGHEHQRSDFWKLLKPYLNVAAMKRQLSRFGVDGGSFVRDWSKCKKNAEGKSTPYDSQSVMHYWFMKDWLKPPYNIRSNVMEDSKPGGPLKPEVVKVLLGVHDRDGRANPPPESPSNRDILLLIEQYGSEEKTEKGEEEEEDEEGKCTRRGPPPAGGGEVKHTQDPKVVSMYTLSNLKIKTGEKISIMNKVAPYWKRFALQLDFDNDGTTIQTIDQKCGPDPEACCREMISLWLTGKGRQQPVTWELLVEILSDSELKVLANQVEEVTCVQE